MPKFYATIRPTSKYANQCNGEPFQVHLDDHPTDGYIWRGGPGGQYRHSDLQLYVKHEDSDVLSPVPMFAAGEQVAFMDLILSGFETRAQTGDLYPEWINTWSEEVINRLQKIRATNEKNYVEEGE